MRRHVASSAFLFSLARRANVHRLARHREQIFTCRRLAKGLAGRNIANIILRVRSRYGLNGRRCSRGGVEFLQPVLRDRRARALNTNEVPSVSS